MNLAGKTILVTGGAGIGVGGGVCQAVQQAGGRLVINDLKQADVERTAARFEAAIPLAGDVSIDTEVERMFAALNEAGIILDGLVNSAGVGLQTVAYKAQAQDYDRLLSIDLRAVWLMSKAFVLHLQETGKTGSIVNISSVHGIQTMKGYGLYASVKSGVEGITRGLAVELGPLRIRCNAVAPGYVHSEQGLDLIRTWTDDPEGWVHNLVTNFQAIPDEIEPIDCGWAAVYFLSDVSRRVTGQVLRVDAGTTSLVMSMDSL